MAELAARSGVSVASIKFYIREGLLPAGSARSRTQADYDDTHVRRLRLIRVLREIGGLSVARIGEIVAVLDDPAVGLHDLLGTVQYAVSGAAEQSASAEAVELARGLGWHVAADSPALARLGAMLPVVRSLGIGTSVADLRPWAEAAMLVARREVTGVPDGASRDEQVEYVAAGTVVMGRVLAELRLLAQESVSSQLFG